MKAGKRLFARTLVGAAVVAALGLSGGASAAADDQGRPARHARRSVRRRRCRWHAWRRARGQASAAAWWPARRSSSIKASSDAKPDVAVNATRKLVEQDKVQIMVGPLSGGEGIAVKDYAKTQPNVTFINGGSGAQATTLVNPAPNFFRFNTEGAQWMAGLGKVAYDKGYKRMMVIAEDYAFPYSQVQGFMTEYCKVGGKVPLKAWVPLGGKDYASVIARIPKDVDALLVVLGGADAVNFLNQYEQAGGDKPIVGGSITVSQDVLNYRGKRRESLLGTLSAGPLADAYDGAEWKKFVADYKKNFPDGYPSPSLFAYVYYMNMKAALDGLAAVNGDLSDGGTKYRDALSKLTLKTPTGDVKLDANRQAIGTTFITEVVKDDKGNFYNKVVQQDRQRQPDARGSRRPSSRSARATCPIVLESAGSTRITAPWPRFPP